MSFQIAALAVYNATGQRRDVEFNLGGVSIVTGASKTGKSALIHIMDYCLGRTDYLIPAGKIRDSVVWFAIKIQTESKQVVIARPAPKRGVQSNTEAFRIEGKNLEFPEFQDLKKTTNTSGLIKYLSELSGITANEHVPDEGHSRDALTANLKHSKFLLFQPQNRIADQTSLFYREEDDGISQAIKDTLPYFLGAVGDDRFDTIQQLRRARRRLKLLEKRLADEEAIRGKDNSRALALLAEAQQCGVADEGNVTTDFSELVAELRRSTDWKPESIGYETDDRVRELREEREDLIIRLENLKTDVEAAKSFALDQKGFSSEVGEQRNRLESIGLFRQQSTDTSHCPLCNSELETPTPTTENIQASLRKINAQIDAVVRQQPRLEKYINERLDAIELMRQRINENKSSLEAIFAQQQELREQRNEVARKAKVVGRISLFLDSVKEVDETASLRSEIVEAERSVRRLEKEVSDEALSERLQTSLSVIGSQMSRWGKELNLEHSEYPLSLDVKNLTVRGFDGTEPITMAKMGSGANWVGCHIIAHLGLHSWFVKQNRPVPRFLMFDQPTQAYFPADEQVKDRSVDDLKDEDREAVARMFGLIFDVVESLSPRFQVIITDHADLLDERFQAAVVGRWRNGTFLVPAEWYS